MQVCKIDGCASKAVAHCLCWMHYYRLRKYGDPEKLKQWIICSIDGCSARAKVGGLCRWHHQNGNVSKPTHKKRTGLCVKYHAEYRVWANMKRRCLDQKIRAIRIMVGAESLFVQNGLTPKFYHGYGTKAG
jgi:hypothetical protein